MTATDALLRDALEHHQAGRLGEAAALYQQILTATPEHADALHLMGVIANQSLQLDAVTGASYTEKSFLKAVEAALAK